jgi:hypothetical protein
VAKSDTHVLEGTNVSVRLFEASGTVLDTKVTADFFSLPPEGFALRMLVDPKTYFDRNATSRRFF